MSTIAAQNYGDGTDSVPASAVIEGTGKAAFRYTQSTPVVDSSYNVSGITDDSEGEFTVSFTNAFANALQEHSGMVLTGSGRVITVTGGSASASSYRTTNNAAGADLDTTSSAVVLGELA